MLGSVTRKDVTSRGLLLPMHPAGCRRAHTIIGLSVSVTQRARGLYQIRKQALAVDRSRHPSLLKECHLHQPRSALIQSTVVASMFVSAPLEIATQQMPSAAPLRRAPLHASVLNYNPRGPQPSFVENPANTRQPGLCTGAWFEVWGHWAGTRNPAILRLGPGAPRCHSAPRYSVPGGARGPRGSPNWAHAGPLLGDRLAG